MSRRTLHSHPCATKGCINRVPCDGTLERNHDGYPEVICSTYHLPSGDVNRQQCASCAERVETVHAD